jgi:hypothetical protein
MGIRISSTFHTLRTIEGLNYYCATQDSTDDTKSGEWMIQSRPLPRQKQTLWDQTIEESVPVKLVRHKCRLEDYLGGILNITSAEIKGLELAQYLSA